ncbi:unnamed protein product [Phytophthora lilii]|uniref:Unnamed protein product n=1 Tax=Phytophthora lilii TaxID=2077276 RepID=A0A9W6WF99_9STRA|nr:unnamed protein product [Phytophthora lilii]
MLIAVRLVYLYLKKAKQIQMCSRILPKTCEDNSSANFTVDTKLRLTKVLQRSLNVVKEPEHQTDLHVVELFFHNKRYMLNRRMAKHAL